jgi:hypothetical protein
MSMLKEVADLLRVRPNAGSSPHLTPFDLMSLCLVTEALSILFPRLSKDGFLLSELTPRIRGVSVSAAEREITA